MIGRRQPAPRGWDTNWDISDLRVPAGEHLYGYPERPIAFHDFVHGLEVDDLWNITFSRGPEWHHGITSDETGVLPNCYYMVNTDGRHWYEFENNADVVTLGCSITAGMGIPLEYTWPAIYQAVTGKIVNNIGKPGATIAQMVYRFFHHISHYGKPKAVYIALGDHMRYWLQKTPPRFGAQTSDEIIFWEKDTRTYVGPYGRPHTFTDSRGVEVMLSPDICVGENLRALEMLAFYCDAEKIELQIHPFSQVVQGQFKKMGWKPLAKPSTDSPSEPLDRDQELFWNFGFDFHPDSQHTAHPGLRHHLDIASAFLGRILTQQEQEQITTWCSHRLDHSAAKFDNSANDDRQ